MSTIEITSKIEALKELEALIDEAKVFHFGPLSLTDEPARSATHKAVAYAKEKGKLITFDPNLRKPLCQQRTYLFRF